MRSLTRSMAYISLVLLLFSAHAIHIGDRNARDLSALQDGVVAKHQLHTHEGHHKDLPTGFAPHALYGTIKNLLEARLRKWQDGEPMLSPQIISWDPSIPLFRAQDAAWPRTSEIINGYGAKFAGGRWNPKNTPAVYTAYTDTTALEECKAASKRKDEVQTYPRIFVVVQMSTSDAQSRVPVLDLAGDSLQKFADECTATAGVLNGDTIMMEKWSELQKQQQESFSQAIGRACDELGIGGIIADSQADKRTEESADGGPPSKFKNVILFPESPGVTLDVKDQKVLDQLLSFQSESDETIAQWRAQPALAGQSGTQPDQLYPPPDNVVGYAKVEGHEVEFVDADPTQQITMTRVIDLLRKGIGYPLNIRKHIKALVASKPWTFRFGQAAKRVEETLFHKIKQKITESLAHKGPGQESLIKVWDPAIPLFRVVDAAWSRPAEITNGMGASIWGGRWNPKEIPAVYTAFTDNTALEECKAASVKKGELQTYPRLVVTLTSQMEQGVLDLSGRKLTDFMQAVGYEDTGVSWHDEQEQGREAFTQAVGRACSELQVGGLIVDSAADQRVVDAFDRPVTGEVYKNVVLFPLAGEISLRDADVIQRLQQFAKADDATIAEWRRQSPPPGGYQVGRGSPVHEENRWVFFDKPAGQPPELWEDDVRRVHQMMGNKNLPINADTLRDFEPTEEQLYSATI